MCQVWLCFPSLCSSSWSPWGFGTCNRGIQPCLWEVLLTRGPFWAGQVCGVSVTPAPRAGNRPSIIRSLCPTFWCSTKPRAAKLWGGKSAFAFVSQSPVLVLPGYTIYFGLCGFALMTGEKAHKTPGSDFSRSQWDLLPFICCPLRQLKGGVGVTTLCVRQKLEVGKLSHCLKCEDGKLVKHDYVELQLLFSLLSIMGYEEEPFFSTRNVVFLQQKGEADWERR